jgi:hypothetical protein
MLKGCSGLWAGAALHIAHNFLGQWVVGACPAPPCARSPLIPSCAMPRHHAAMQPNACSATVCTTVHAGMLGPARCCCCCVGVVALGRALWLRLVEAAEALQHMYIGRRTMLGQHFMLVMVDRFDYLLYISAHCLHPLRHLVACPHIQLWQHCGHAA